MFEISHNEDGLIRLSGRFDASQVQKAKEILERVDGPAVVDFSDLSYISSAGLGVLFSAQKRLTAGGPGLTLKNLSPHIREIFSIAGFDRIFEIE